LSKTGEPVKTKAETDKERFERRQKALALRLACQSYHDIADALGTSAPTAFRDVRQAMRETLQEPADRLRKLESLRLDRIQAKNEMAYARGEITLEQYTDRCLKIIKARRELLGLDKPANVKVEGAHVILEWKDAPNGGTATDY